MRFRNATGWFIGVIFVLYLPFFFGGKLLKEFRDRTVRGKIWRILVLIFVLIPLAILRYSAVFSYAEWYTKTKG